MWCSGNLIRFFGNLFWGNHLRCFGTKFRSMDTQVLFRSFRAKTTQSTTAITSIVIRVANQLRIKCESAIFRHTERSEVSKSREFQTNSESMTKERMGELYRFTQSKKIVGDLRIAKMDSSATLSPQNDESMDYHDFAIQNLTMTESFRFGIDSPKSELKGNKCLKTQKRQLLRF